MPKYFRFPFARSGDKAAVPDAVVPAGNVSYDQGYGPDYELPKTNPQAKDIERNKMNQVLNDITDAVRYVQELGVSAWIANADNGGVAFPYAKGARVMYTDNKIYVSQKAANTSLPTVAADWFEESGRLARVSVYVRLAGVQNVRVNGGAATPTGAGTFTPMAGMKFVIVRASGGGGAGGGPSLPTAGNVTLGSPGSSGAGGVARFEAATVGASQAVVVGLKGAKVVGGTGGTGGTTSFGALATFPGGTGGGLLVSQAPPSVNGNGASIVPTGANVLEFKGSGGAPTFSITAGANGGVGGMGGGSMFGQGAAGNAGNNGGIDAQNVGAGGSGAVINNGYGGSAAGGDGGDGVLIVEEYI